MWLSCLDFQLQSRLVEDKRKSFKTVAVHDNFLWNPCYWCLSPRGILWVEFWLPMCLAVCLAVSPALSVFLNTLKRSCVFLGNLFVFKFLIQKAKQDSEKRLNICFEKTIRHYHQILFPILSKSEQIASLLYALITSEWISFYSPWSHHEITGILMISGAIEVS